MQILQLFFDCDEFCREFLPRLAAQQLADGKRHRQCESSLSPSEVMTIVILFHHSGFRNFKSYYTQHVCQLWRAEFSRLVGYQRMVELKPYVLVPLAGFLHSRFGNCSGISLRARFLRRRRRLSATRQRSLRQPKASRPSGRAMQ
ncbi:MAG: hypothetical protein JST85_11650 [Acidobacteria bacterium]|nr:hypothetical protein [Acidobacteriota bacterium]